MPGRGPGRHFQDQAAGGEVVGERGQFGGVAAEPLQLAHMTRQCGVYALTSRAVLSATSKAGRTRTRVLIFFVEDFVPRDAVLAERVELGVE